MKRKSYAKLKSRLEKENINTWFDMGLLLDRLRDSRESIARYPHSYKSYLSLLGKGVAFITFDYGVDGVTIEIEKYSKIISTLIKNTTDIEPKIYWVGSEFNLKQRTLDCKCEFFRLEGGEGFDKWDGYSTYFFKKLTRGSDDYNELAKKVWKQTFDLSLRLGKFIEENDITLLIPVNVNSNPGNVSLAFAIVLVSEIMGIPVLNNNHDFYWEDGHRGDKKPPGIRDHFFTNSHIGEVFSLIEMLYPWDSPRWLQMVINPIQRSTLVNRFGFNPIAVKILSTSVDTQRFRPFSKDEKKMVLEKLHVFFADSRKILHTKPIQQFIASLDLSRDLHKPVVLGASDRALVKFASSNILILQPTRILKRKQIERNFDLLISLFNDPSFRVFLEQNKKMTLTLLVTGPVSTGQEKYFIELLHKFKALLDHLPPTFRERLFLAFKFGMELTPQMEKMNIEPISIEELYAAADLVVLPSKSEGRGLPIIESCACGTPIIVNRYEPEAVFSYVIGEHLERSKRLIVFEFPKENSRLPKNFINLYNRPEYSSKILIQNRKNIKKRYSYKTLENYFDQSLYVLWKRSQPTNITYVENVKKTLEDHEKITQYDDLFHKIVLANNRKYYPGISPIEFMVVLKSLIDPSFFRMEEKALKGRVMRFTQNLVRNYEKYAKLDFKQKLAFFTNVDVIFEYYTGEDEISMDHSLSYRHRHSRHYPYRKMTEFELYGIISSLFRCYIKYSENIPLNIRMSRMSESIQSSLISLVGYRKLAIDDRNRLVQALKSDKPFAWFPGNQWLLEIELFVVATLKWRLGLKPEQKITDEMLASDKIKQIGKIYLFVRKKSIGTAIYYRNIIIWLKKLAHPEIKAIYQAGLLEVVETEVVSACTHLGQLGREAKQTLVEIKNQGGFIVAVGEENYLPLDLVDLPSYRIGIARYPFLVHYLGIKKEQGFIQWVPAGLTPCLAYPTPVQTGSSFSATLKGKMFKRCVELHGEQATLNMLRDDADKHNTPIKKVLRKIAGEEQKEKQGEGAKYIDTKMLIGLHNDGLPWSGAIATVDLKEGRQQNSRFEFRTVFSPKTGKTVLDLVKSFEKKHHEKVVIAWNGGYMLNPELVGKLGLPEKYIGSPLGLVITDGEIQSLPLYNKPAFVVNKDFSIAIRSTHLRDGVKISVPDGDAIEFKGEDRNRTDTEGAVYFDLLYPELTIPAKNRTIYRFAGNRIISKIKTNEETVNILPVGLTVSVPADWDLKGWTVGTTVHYTLPGWSDVLQAVEAGPLLVDDKSLAINMEKEGWKTRFSIATQAARVDYEHLRGPKIGAGLTEDNHLVIVAINGRIRESVGTTHIELANILIKQGCVRAMGFDPGGSVTLLVNGEQVNISPYNQDYEKNPFSLPPQARRIGNAILCYYKKE